MVTTTPIVQEGEKTTRKSPMTGITWVVAPFIVHVAEQFIEDTGGVTDVFLSKTANPEATMTGKERDDTNG